MFLEQSAERFPDKVALICGKQRLTYKTIEERCNKLAHALIDAGVKRGDRVAISLENSVESVLAVFAILKAGAVFLMITPTTKAEKMAFILNNCRATALFVHSARLTVIQNSTIPSLQNIFAAGPPRKMIYDQGVPQVFFLDEIISSERTLTPPPKQSIDVDMAAILYTSGSTGNPKGVVMAHYNIVSVATSIENYLGSNERDIVLVVLSISFGYGLYQILVSFKVGATAVLERSFTYPYEIIERIKAEKVTVFASVPTISAILLQMDMAKVDFSSLCTFTNAGSGIPVAHLQKIRKLFPHVKIFSMYGLTECQRVCYLPPDQVDVRPSSVGIAIPNEEVYIVDEMGNKVLPGVTGELVIRGSHVMQGYWEMPEATNRVLKQGDFPWERVLYSGDLFKTDDLGYLYFVARKDDIVKICGEKVSPREVEEVLYKLESVEEAAVIGVSDPVLGQAIKAMVVLKKDAQLTEQALLLHCSQHLEMLMVPKVVEFRTEFPKTPTGKINKRAL